MNWPNGNYQPNNAWWEMPGDERAAIIQAIDALDVTIADVAAVEFGDDAATFTLFHVTEEAGRAHLEGHCHYEAAGNPCSCGRPVGESHPVCVRVETVKYPA